MVFSSNLFLFYFLAAVLILYYASPRALRLSILALCSYVFYAWSDPKFVLLLWWVTGVDFAAGNFIGGHWKIGSRTLDARGKKILLGISLTNSLGLLAYFKYFGLAEEMVNRGRGMLGMASWPVLSVVLPAGISFYTFESISYVVDIYRGIARPAPMRFLDELSLENAPFRGAAKRVVAEVKAFVAFACYLAQFPHLVAGPIIRYQEIEPQMHRPMVGVEKFARGIFFFSMGLAKKVLLADTVSRAVEPVFAAAGVSLLDAWWALLAFAFQIYFDFSGYSDMVIGLGMMLGFDFPRNFDAPYRAASITEFWRRWHMTLSSWLRDYVYIPLGGNRRGERRTYVNLILTMLLGGLWHGAAWNFVAWGAYHGAWLAIERRRGRRGIAAGLGRPVEIAVTFAIVCAGWMIFRSPGIEMVGRGAVRLIGLGGATPELARAAMYDLPVIIAMAASAALAFGPTQVWDMAKELNYAKAVLAIVLFCASVIVLAVNSSSPFLYSRF
jgi:alginate O-acetyltransferase complex protein AlgI